MSIFEIWEGRDIAKEKTDETRAVRRSGRFKKIQNMLNYYPINVS